MLRNIARRLVDDGWYVLLPSRLYSPMPVDTEPEPTGRALWVEAHWDDPGGLARRVSGLLGDARADLLVTWLHEAYRDPVLRAVEPLVSPNAPVVDVRSQPGAGEVPGQSDPRLLCERATQYVSLGQRSSFDEGRPLGHAEVLAGVSTAVDRALAGAASARHDIGRRRLGPKVPRPRVRGVTRVPPPRRSMVSRRAAPGRPVNATS